jgi:spore germination protein YaaH
MKYRLLRIAALTMMVMLSAGCMGNIESSAHAEVELSAWVAYWDADSGMKEYQSIKGRLQGMSYFAASFQKNGKLIVPEEIKSAKAKADKDKNGQSYLTIVNDIRYGNDDIKEKDTAILYKVLKNDKAIQRHIKDILLQAEAGKYDGVEIDYEKIWKDDKLREAYLSFLRQLCEAATEHDLRVRVVLEPSAPFEADFPAGPEYVVMFYNLYGTHSGPGPKADGDFIVKAMKKMAKLPGDKTAAFATGGCVWEDTGLLHLRKGKKAFISESEAVERQMKYKAEVKRDKESACLYYTYEEKGKQYIVWYADSETLNAWITLAADQGVRKVSLWRLGSNTDIEEVQ